MKFEFLTNSLGVSTRDFIKYHGEYSFDIFTKMGPCG